jgi:hypothetical protein
MEYQFPRGVWSLDMTQDGDEVALFTLERNFETGLAEIGYGTWAPGSGFSPRTVFGSYSAKFGGSVFSVPRGANIRGLSDFRSPDERLVTKAGIQRFGGREIGLTCDGTHETSAAVYPDGSGLLAKTHRENCGPLHCRFVVFMSTNVDGGRSCPLEGLSAEEVGADFVLGRLILHPNMRVAGMANVTFFSWDEGGRRLAYVIDAGVRVGKFWPTTERPPTRVESQYANGFGRQYDETGVPYFYTWEDAGVVRHEAPFAPYMNEVWQLVEVPTGVIVQGVRFAPPGSPAREIPVGILVDKTGSRVLGKFRRRSDGRELAPNVYVEGQYFYIWTTRRGGPDERWHGFAEIEAHDFVPLP